METNVLYFDLVNFEKNATGRIAMLYLHLLFQYDNTDPLSIICIFQKNVYIKLFLLSTQQHNHSQYEYFFIFDYVRIRVALTSESYIRDPMV